MNRRCDEWLMAWVSELWKKNLKKHKLFLICETHMIEMIYSRVYIVLQNAERERAREWMKSNNTDNLDYNHNMCMGGKGLAHLVLLFTFHFVCMIYFFALDELVMPHAPLLQMCKSFFSVYFSFFIIFLIKIVLLDM